MTIEKYHKDQKVFVYLKNGNFKVGHIVGKDTVYLFLKDSVQGHISIPHAEITDIREAQR